MLEFQGLFLTANLETRLARVGGRAGGCIRRRCKRRAPCRNNSISARMTWSKVDASGTAEETQIRARAMLQLELKQLCVGRPAVPPPRSWPCPQKQCIASSARCSCQPVPRDESPPDPELSPRASSRSGLPAIAPSSISIRRSRSCRCCRRNSAPAPPKSPPSSPSARWRWR